MANIIPVNCQKQKGLFKKWFLLRVLPRPGTNQIIGLSTTKAFKRVTIRKSRPIFLKNRRPHNDVTGVLKNTLLHNSMNTPFGLTILVLKRTTIASCNISFLGKPKIGNFCSLDFDSDFDVTWVLFYTEFD